MTVATNMSEVDNPTLIHLAAATDQLNCARPGRGVRLPTSVALVHRLQTWFAQCPSRPTVLDICNLLLFKDLHCVEPDARAASFTRISTCMTVKADHIDEVVESTWERTSWISC